MPIVDRYGADAARCYILFIGPPDQDAAWSESSLAGVHKFLGRLWRLGHGASGQAAPAAPVDAEGDALTLVRKANWAIDKVTTGMTGRFTFDTAIAAIMELVNEIYHHLDAEIGARRFAVATAASLLFPFPRTSDPRSTDGHRRASVGGAMAQRRREHVAVRHVRVSARSTARSATA